MDLSETILQITIATIPVLITGIWTFLITKYSYSKEMPLDKLEISYNRIYYPIYYYMFEEKKDMEYIINDSKTRFKKYKKYIDRSTLSVFNTLCNTRRQAKKKHVYKNFQDNIIRKNGYLRKKLGYLEPDFFQMFKYGPDEMKALFVNSMEVLAIYILAIAYNIINNSWLKQVIAGIDFVVIVIWIVGLVVMVIKALFYIIKK